jgi:hypothetical protein
MAVVLVAGVAVVLVALAADGDPLRVTSAGRAVGDVPDWLLLVPLAGVALAVVGLVTLLRDRPGPGPRRVAHRRSIIPSLAAIAFAALIASLIGRPGDDEAGPTDPAPALETAPAPISEADGGTSWPTWLLVACAAVVAGAATITRIGRTAAPDPAGEVRPEAGDDDAAASAVESLVASADDLATTAEPRAAVIAAYARLLDGLGRAGAARRPAEAPFEHVARALRLLGVRPAPLERLAALFAEARFSTHSITEDHRQEAADCLHAALDDLRAVACV